MAPGFTEYDEQTVRVTEGVRALNTDEWAEYGVYPDYVADARSGTRTTIFLLDGRSVVVERRD